MNLSYNPEKSKTDIFLEELALQIDYGITKNTKKILPGDFNKNYLKPSKKNWHNFCTLWSINGQQNTNKGENLIDFVIRDGELTHSNVFTFE